MSNLILIEGIPGSGKTTASKFVQQIIMDQGIDAKSYQEGDLHPADLSWQSLLPISEFHRLLELHPNYSDAMMKFSSIEGKVVITAYNRMGLNQKSDLYKILSQNDIYTKNVELSTFKEEHLRRWKRFSQESDDNSIYIFECALLQNHITELMLKYEASNAEIFSYMNDFFNVIESMSPIVVYLAPTSVEKAIKHVANERTMINDPRRTSNWIDRAVQEISESKYGIHNNISDVSGCIEYYNNRQMIELDLLKQLKIDSHIIKHNGDDWDNVRNAIRNICL